MALSAKLAMRQGQAMVLTPQLLQAIKLLQMPNSELAAFIENELERNPLLDRADDRPTPEAAAAEPPTPDMDVTAGDWASENLEFRSRRPSSESGHRNRKRVRPGPRGDSRGTRACG